MPPPASPNIPPNRHWDTRFKQPLEKDDPLWKEYLDEATAFDDRMVDEWNKAIDVILVYVALFTAILTAFVVVTIPQFQPASADISNQLLFAIYQNQLALLGNGSPDIITNATVFQLNHSDYNNVVFYNALLMADMALSVIVSMIALFAKIWVIHYHEKVNSSGSPYERAMRRQEAYSGVLAWKLGEIINSLPFLLLIAVFMFGLFIYRYIATEQNAMGNAIGTILLLGFIFLMLLSIAAAFVPGCPFHSSLSSFIGFIFSLFPKHKPDPKQPNSRKLRPLRLVSLVFVSYGVLSVSAASARHYSGAFFALFCFPVAAGFAMVGNPPRLAKRPRFEWQNWVLCESIVVVPVMIVAARFMNQQHIFIPSSWTAVGLIAIFSIAPILYYKFTPETREPDAIAWLIGRTSSQQPEHFTKAGQIAQSASEEGSEHHKALLLNSLLPLISSLITSRKLHQSRREGPIQVSRQDGAESCVHHCCLHRDHPKQTAAPSIDHLEVYVACLAQLSAFEDKKAIYKENEAKLEHPPLPESLHTILTELKKLSNELGFAASHVLEHYPAVPQSA